MPRKRSPVLTDAELRIMDVLWELGESTVADAVKAVSKRASLAYNTVLTTMRILEKKGYVTHRQEGRAFVYRPLVDRQEVRRSTVKHLLSRLFDDSPELLVLNVLEDGDLDRAELERLKRLVDEAGGKEPRR